MNKINKNKIILALVLAVVFLLSIFVFSNYENKENDIRESILEENIENTEQNIIENTTEDTTEEILVQNTVKNTVESNPNNTEIQNVADSLPSVGEVDLVAGDLNIKLDIKNGETFYDVLVREQSEGTIKFDGKKYTGLGFFVTEIGNLSSKDGGYLIYYINGKEASVGVSAYIPKDKDFIEWKLE